MVVAKSLMLDKVLGRVTKTVEASVLVGGTLLWTHHSALASCAARGVQVRFLFPSPTSTWLADYVTSAGGDAEDYAYRIQVNSSRAREIGAAVRFHESPVAVWFAMFDRTSVASKPVALLNDAMPELSTDLSSIRQFASLFDGLWLRASEVPSQPKVHATDSGTMNQANGVRSCVFLCHASDDKSAVRAVYEKLRVHGIDTWLDEIDILPGQDWDLEIRSAVKRSRAVIVFLSATSVSKSGYLQKEISFVLDVAAEQPEGRIFIIPARLQDCAVPGSFRRLQYVDLFKAGGFEKLVQALHGSREK